MAPPSDHNNSTQENNKTSYSQQVKDHLPTAVVDTYEHLPSVHDVQESVYNLFASFAPTSLTGTNGEDKDKKQQQDDDSEESKKKYQTTYLFQGVNMQDFVDWFHKNAKDEKDDKSRFEKIQNWFSQQQNKADKQLNKASDNLESFKKDIDELFDKHSSSHQEKKTLLEQAHLDWDSLQSWYNKNVLGQEPEKTRFEKVKDWINKQTDSADKKLNEYSAKASEDLEDFKKDMDKLFDKHSSSHVEEKSILENLGDKWSDLKKWYNENVLGQEPEKTRYEKVKEWLGMNKKQ